MRKIQLSQFRRFSTNYSAPKVLLVHLELDEFVMKAGPDLAKEQWQYVEDHYHLDKVTAGNEADAILEGIVDMTDAAINYGQQNQMFDNEDMVMTFVTPEFAFYPASAIPECVFLHGIFYGVHQILQKSPPNFHIHLASFPIAITDDKGWFEETKKQVIKSRGYAPDTYPEPVIVNAALIGHGGQTPSLDLYVKQIDALDNRYVADFLPKNLGGVRLEYDELSTKNVSPKTTQSNKSFTKVHSICFEAVKAHKLPLRTYVKFMFNTQHEIQPGYSDLSSHSIDFEQTAESHPFPLISHNDVAHGPRVFMLDEQGSSDHIEIKADQVQKFDSQSRYAQGKLHFFKPLEMVLPFSDVIKEIEESKKLAAEEEGKDSNKPK